VLLVNNEALGKYLIGHFDGKQFVPADFPANGDHLLDYGPDYYAATTFYETEDNAATTIGWMDNWGYAKQMPTSPWRGQMSVPRTLKVCEGEKGKQLCHAPRKEVNELFKERVTQTFLTKAYHASDLIMQT